MDFLTSKDIGHDLARYARNRRVTAGITLTFKATIEPIGIKYKLHRPVVQIELPIHFIH